MAFPEAMAAVQRHLRAVETLAALGARLGAEAGQVEPDEGLRAKLDAVMQAFEPALLDGLDSEEIEALYGFVRAGFRQMHRLLELPDGGSAGWNHDDPHILETQGRSSRLVTRLVTDYAGTNAELSSLLSGPAEFLDVGSGVGWISLSMAQQWPNLSATGIDILRPALELAETNLSATGLADRVRFRMQNVVALDDEDAFDLAFMPIIFIPEQIVDDALARLARALKPGGWLFLAGYRVPEDTGLAVLNDLKTALSGGRVWTSEQMFALAVHAGLTPLEDVGTGSPLHLLAARRAT